MKRRAVVVLMMTVALVASACGGGGDDAAADEAVAQVAEMQAEINRLRAQLDLVTTGTTSVASATTLSLDAGQAADLVPVFDAIFIGIAERIGELDASAQRANTAWESQTASYDDTHGRLTTVVADSGAISDVMGLLPIPIDLATRYTDVIAAIEEFELAARALLAGLEAPDDGSLRRQAATRVGDTAERVVQAVAFG